MRWIAKIRFGLDRLDTRKIIDLVMAAAGMLTSGNKNGQIRARLLAHGGGSSVETVFSVRRRGLFRLEVEIAPVRP